MKSSLVMVSTVIDGTSGPLNREPRRQWRATRYWLQALFSAAALLVLMTACGGDEPAAEPDATSTAGQSGQAASTSATAAPSVGQLQPGQAPATPAELTLGELVDRINAQLTGLDAFREVSISRLVSSSSPSSLPAASPANERPQRTTRDVRLPDQVKHTAEQDGQLEFELIVIGDRVFARGSVAALLDAEAGTDEWIETDIATVAASPLFGEAAASQFSNPLAPRYAVPERLRPQPVRRLDPVTVDGVQCEVFGAADTTESGARIDLTFAIDADDRLCFVQTEAIGLSSRYTVEPLADSAVISPPPVSRRIATPVASPVLDATPVTAATPLASPLPAP